MKKTVKEVAAHCKKVRREKRLTQLDIAKTVNYSISAISKFESGERDSLAIYLAYVEVCGKEILNGIFS